MRRFLFHLLPFLSAVLLWLAFHPADLGILGWPALAPLLVYAVRAPRAWLMFLCSWLAGWVFFAAGLSWMAHAAPVGPPAIALYKALYFSFFALFVRILARRMPLALAAPALWTALEYARSHLFSGLPYLLLGYTQHELLTLIQIADVGGPWVVGALVVLVNAAVARAILVRLEGRVVMRDAGFRSSLAAASIAMCAAWGYGMWRLSKVELEDGPRIAVIQPNIPQEAKNISLGEEQARRIFDKHVALTRQVCEQPGKRDLIVWPESVIYGGLLYSPDTGRYAGSFLLDDMTALSRDVKTPIFFGSEVGEVPADDPYAFDRYEYTNSAILVDGERGIVYRYNKCHLVLFTEKIPKLPFVEHFTEKYTGYKRLVSFRAGTRFNQFEVGGRRVGTIICFENVFPEISREYARNGAEILVNISNEGWFKGSAELDQMLVISRFRAIENRISIVRGTNTGISGVIEPTGQIATLVGTRKTRWSLRKGSSEVWIPGKEVEGTLDVTVKVSRTGSPYRRIGDGFAWLACAFAAGALAWAGARRMLTVRNGEDRFAR